MKRFLSVLLILGVLCSLALPVSALTEPGYIPIFEPTERELSSGQEGSDIDHERCPT